MATQQRIFISSTAADRYLVDESRTDVVAFDLNEPVVCKSNQRMYLSLESFSFPNTMYNITSDNNKITFDSATITIPVGQYATADALKTAIAAAITANGTITVVVGYSSLLNKFTFQNTSSATSILVKKESTMSYVIGLLPSTDLTLPISSTTDLPRQVDVSNGRTINFAIQNLDLNGIDSNGGRTLSNILCTVPITAKFGDIQGFTNPNNNKVLINQKSLTYLEVALINLNNEPFNLGGLRWSGVLLVTIE